MKYSSDKTLYPVPQKPFPLKYLLSLFCESKVVQYRSWQLLGDWWIKMLSKDQKCLRNLQFWQNYTRVRAFHATIIVLQLACMIVKKVTRSAQKVTSVAYMYHFIWKATIIIKMNQGDYLSHIWCRDLLFNKYGGLRVWCQINYIFRTGGWVWII